MLADALKRFAPFSELDAAGLAAAATHARLIELPARRWLVRHGRPLNRHLYLVAGEVRAVDEAGRVRSVQGEIYRPGDALAIETRAATTVLSVDCAPLQFLLSPAGLPAPEVEEVADWLERLLASPLVQAMPAVTWQRVLRHAGERRLAPGEWLRPEDAVYIVQSGTVERDGRTYRAGQFFGEEVAFGEAVTGGPKATGRDASAYVAVQATRLLVLPGKVARELLIDYPLTAPIDAQLVDLDQIPLAALTRHAERLSKDRPVGVRGGRAGQRALALIALTRLGFAAAPASAP